MLQQFMLAKAAAKHRIQTLAEMEQRPGMQDIEQIT
jgi:hypothetical protein